MATHSSILAWRIPWTKEPGGLWSIRFQRVRHNWLDLSAAAATWHVLFSTQGFSTRRNLKVDSVLSPSRILVSRTWCRLMSVYIFFEAQLILEQHKFELYKSTYTHIFFNKYIEKHLEFTTIWKIHTKMWHRDMKWANAIRSMVLIDLPSAGLSQTFNL